MEAEKVDDIIERRRIRKLEAQQQAAVDEMEKVRREIAMEKSQHPPQLPVPAQPDRPARALPGSFVNDLPGAIDVLIETDYPLRAQPPHAQPPQPFAGPGPAQGPPQHAAPPGPAPAPAPPAQIRVPLQAPAPEGRAGMLANGLILDRWMPGHPHYMPPSVQSRWQPPPGPRPCLHGRSEWFLQKVDPEMLEFPYSANFQMVRLESQSNCWLVHPCEGWDRTEPTRLIRDGQQTNSLWIQLFALFVCPSVRPSGPDRTGLVLYVLSVRFSERSQIKPDQPACFPPFNLVRDVVWK